MYYSNQERRKEILEFVRLNPETTKSKVISHMKKLHMGTLMTTQPLLIQLIDSGKITVLKDKPNSRNHRLVFNNENEFSQIDGKLRRLKENINELNEELLYTISIINQMESESKIIRTDTLANLIHLLQPLIFTIVTEIVTNIGRNIKSNEDRQALYHRLPDVLLVSNELNKIISPEVLRLISRAMHETEEDWETDPENESIYYTNIVTSIEKIVQDFK